MKNRLMKILVLALTVLMALGCLALAEDAPEAEEASAEFPTEEEQEPAEPEAAPALMTEEKQLGIRPGPETAPQPKNMQPLRIILVIAAIGFIIAGVFNGSARDVLYKAINICTECVGLG